MNEDKREIKFRVLDKKNKKMIYLNLYQAVHYKEDFILRQNDWGDGNWIDDHCGNVEWDLMQYTGLEDKNGMEIYEFDILQNNAGAKRVVEQTKYGEYKLFCGEHSDSFYKGWMPNTEWEVIGNIYENPDLIKLI